jgi:hypothetical protein
VIDGIKTVELSKLIGLKRASGMTSPGRLKDLADVQELIGIKQSNAAYAQQLDSFVRDRYLELYDGVRQQCEQDQHRESE